jgi:tetratricopeptide (TPR) repeat protein
MHETQLNGDFAKAEFPPCDQKEKEDGVGGLSWYSGLTSLFAAREGRQHDDWSSGNLHSIAGPMSDDHREDVDDESTTVSTVSTLGKGMGDDLASLPSVKDSIAEEDESMASLETEGHSRSQDIKKEPKSKKVSRSVSKVINVEDVVERKISNLKIDGSEAETCSERNSVPFLRRKLFPHTSGRDATNSQSNSDTILETRRQILVRELRNAVNRYGRYNTRCANITAALGDLYDENREHKQAIRLHQDAISVYSVKLGDDHETTIEAKTRLGKVQQNAGEYDDAISTFFNVLCMVKALKGDKDPLSSDAMVNLADALRQNGKYDLAVKTLKRALKVSREALGDSHPSVSRTVDEIASLYITMGDYSKGSAILEEVIKLKAATKGIGSEEVASSLSELATCYECAEQYSKAMKNLKKAYKIHVDISGESGESAVLTLERIALIYQATGQFKKAAIAYLGVLRGRKLALGESHPTVADTYFQLGVSLRESKQRDKAFKCMKQALNIYVGEGKDMHDVEMIAEVMHEMAIIHKANNNTEDAIKTFKQEIAVRRKLGQPEYPIISQTFNHLGVAEYESRNHNKALTYFMEALNIYKTKGHSSGTDFAEVLYNTGLVFDALRNKQRAHDAFLEAAHIFKMNGYDETHPHLSKAAKKLRRLGHTCQCRNRQCLSVPCESILERRRVVGRRQVSF